MTYLAPAIALALAVILAWFGAIGPRDAALAVVYFAAGVVWTANLLRG